jgi:hypothetical protein
MGVHYHPSYMGFFARVRRAATGGVSCPSSDEECCRMRVYYENGMAWIASQS